MFGNIHLGAPVITNVVACELGRPARRGETAQYLQATCVVTLVRQPACMHASFNNSDWYQEPIKWAPAGTEFKVKMQHFILLFINREIREPRQSPSFSKVMTTFKLLGNTKKLEKAVTKGTINNLVVDKKFFHASWKVGNLIYQALQSFVRIRWENSDNKHFLFTMFYIIKHSGLKF